ncbi:hypothetical protein ON010_g18611 [Phytophthora cinnamomi]|nr:hypothetical protein ON010_g18611 [Phytophthora cinnamomi]
MGWGDQTFYIHNIYAPNDATSRKTLFEHLPVNFEESDEAIHVVCGDFNLAIDPELDALLEHPRPDSSRQALTTWLTELNVIDAWRLHHPADKIYTGPIRRQNRIDYMFLSDDLLRSSYHDSNYESWEDVGDHLAHQVELTSWHHPTGPGFWRMPDWLLKTPELRTDIQEEARLMLSVLRSSSNPGIV